MRMVVHKNVNVLAHELTGIRGGVDETGTAFIEMQVGNRTRITHEFDTQEQARGFLAYVVEQLGAKDQPTMGASNDD